MYVLKFRGAGQGPRVLAAEWICGELARILGLPVPDIVGVEVDRGLGDAEPDEEIQDLIHASGGLNLGLDFLPGSLPFSPAAGRRTRPRVRRRRRLVRRARDEPRPLPAERQHARLARAARG